MPSLAYPIGNGADILARCPDALRSLLTHGDVTLYDNGAFRYTQSSGRHPGAMAGWLQPTAGSLAQSSLQSIQALSSLAIGLQVVNIAVSVAGFAIVCHKLNRIEGKLDLLSENLDAVRREVERLNFK